MLGPDAWCWRLGAGGLVLMLGAGGLVLALEAWCWRWRLGAGDNLIENNLKLMKARRCLASRRFVVSENSRLFLLS